MAANVPNTLTALEPDYRRAFEQADFRGYFMWTRKLTRQLGGSLYHACHREALKKILEENELGLRSKWSLKLPQHGTWTAPGTWVGLNYFHDGNYYGPFLLEFPLRVLDGRHFMVLRRQGTDRNRYFFVQYEARIPIYSFGKKVWRNVNPTAYFQKADGDTLAMKPGAIYDIVVTQPISLSHVSIASADHPRCISGTCNGMGRVQSTKQLRKIALGQFYQWLSQDEEYGNLLKRFRCLEGMTIDLLPPDDFD